MSGHPSVEPAKAAPRRALSRADYDRFLPLVRRLAIRVARKVPSHITVNDLVSYGWLGLVEAFSRADPNMPPDELNAYASYRIRGAMLDYLRSLDPTAREIRKRSRDVTNTIARLTKSLERQPEEKEIADAMGLSEDDYREVLAAIAKAGMARLEMLDLDELDMASIEDRPDQEAERHELSKSVATAIRTLPERHQHVLALYYQEECTLREIGSVLGVTESRVSQIHSEAMHRIRAALGKG